MAAMADIAADIEANPHIYVGANGGPEIDQPEPDPFDALKVHTEDLLEQVRGVTKVANEDQLKAVKDLEAELADASKLLDEMRVEKKKPHDDAAQAVQDQFNVYIAPLKNKKPGSIPLALDSLKKAKEPFLKKLEDERVAEANRKREEAEKAAAAAAAAVRIAEPDDFESREAAEELVSKAQRLTRIAGRAEKAASTGSGLRSNWEPTLTDAMAALRHYMADRPDVLKSWLLDQARADIKSGKRTVPGFDIAEDRVAA